VLPAAAAAADVPQQAVIRRRGRKTAKRGRSRVEKKIRLTIGDRSIEAGLNESSTARVFYESLPQSVRMQRWGDEYYGNCSVNVEVSPDARQDMEAGELAIWPDGSALCIFFGPTPASTGTKPRAVSPVNPIGALSGDTAFLKSLPGSITVGIDRI
jgi:hypothetical protein